MVESFKEYPCGSGSEKPKTEKANHDISGKQTVSGYVRFVEKVGQGDLRERVDAPR